MINKRPPFNIDAAVNCVKEYERLKTLGVVGMDTENGPKVALDKETFTELFAGKQVRSESRISRHFPFSYSAEYEGVKFYCITRAPFKMRGCYLEESGAAEEERIPH